MFLRGNIIDFSELSNDHFKMSKTDDFKALCLSYQNSQIGQIGNLY